VYLKFLDKIKKAIKLKNMSKLSQREALLKNETIESEYTRDAIVSEAKKVSEYTRRVSESRRREDRRERIVNFFGGLLGFVVVNGSFIALVNLSSIIELLRWGNTHIFLILVAFLWFAYVYVFALSFFWLSEKTGLGSLIEDWVVSWDTTDTERSHNIHKYKKFSRRKRRNLVKNFKKDFEVVTDQLYSFENEADVTDDKKLSESVENLNQIIGSLITEVDISSRPLIHRLQGASWKNFVLTLEATSNELGLELKDIAKYHKNIQPLLKHASNITSKALYRIIDFEDNKRKAMII
jgi:hypothetical protein